MAGCVGLFVVVLSATVQCESSKPGWASGASGWQRWFFVVLGCGAALFIVWMLNGQSAQRLFCWSLSLILGGALGNVIDRLLHGHVVDFIQLHHRGWYFPSFNVADAAISVGAVLLVIDELRRVRRSK